MALSKKIKVPIPESGITIRRSGEYRYVYKVIRCYRNEKGQATSDRVSIGRVDEESGMLIPNDSYWSLCEVSTIEVLPSFNSVRAIGATFLIMRIFERLGVSSILKITLGNERAERLLTVATYMVCRGNVMEHILDWCEGSTLHEASLCDKQASVLFSSITYDERMAFFRQWVQTHSEDKHLAYDVTSMSSYAKGIQETEWGYNRDGDRLPQLNLGCYYGYESSLPLFYVTYPGSIIDKSHMSYMMAYNKDLGINSVTFVTKQPRRRSTKSVRLSSLCKDV